MRQINHVILTDGGLWSRTRVYPASGSSDRTRCEPFRGSSASLSSNLWYLSPPWNPACYAKCDQHSSCMPNGLTSWEQGTKTASLRGKIKVFRKWGRCISVRLLQFKVVAWNFMISALSLFRSCEALINALSSKWTIEFARTLQFRSFSTK